jgi:hypothetical protein
MMNTKEIGRTLSWKKWKYHSVICYEGPSYKRGKFGTTFQPLTYLTQAHRLTATPTCSGTLRSVNFIFFPVTLLQQLNYVLEANTVTEYVLLQSENVTAGWV